MNDIDELVIYFEVVIQSLKSSVGNNSSDNYEGYIQGIEDALEKIKEYQK